MKEIKGFKGRYMIDEESNIYDIKKNKYLTYHKSNKIEKRAYWQVSLYIEGLRITKKVHQLMAITHLNHVYGDRCVVIDHIDDDKLNNHLDNLQIVSMSYNLLKKNNKNLK